VDAVLKQLSALDTKAFDKTREELEKGWLALQDDIGKLRNLLTQAEAHVIASARIENVPEPIAKKKNPELQEALKKFFAQEKKYVEGIAKPLDELEKHVVELNKYKPGR
jgi:ABC-type transporter Mla subunit MlaD